jgi:ribosomal-protein-serine acetyltransferase
MPWAPQPHCEPAAGSSWTSCSAPLEAMEAPIVANDICIRPFDEGDVAAFVDAARESVTTVGAWMPWCHANYAEAEARAWFDQCRLCLREARSYDLGIFAANGTELLGGVSINQLNVQHNFDNVGYWVRQSRQRRGVASRAVRTMATYGFNCLKLTRLEIVAAVDNLPSRGVAERVGAVLECIARNRLIVNEKPVAAAVYSLMPGQSGL